MPRSGLPHVIMLVSEHPAAAGAMLIWVVCAATEFHDGIWARAVVESHVWVHGRTVASICVDVLDLCYHKGP